MDLTYLIGFTERSVAFIYFNTRKRNSTSRLNQINQMNYAENSPPLTLWQMKIKFKIFELFSIFKEVFPPQGSQFASRRWLKQQKKQQRKASALLYWCFFSTHGGQILLMLRLLDVILLYYIIIIIIASRRWLKQYNLFFQFYIFTILQFYNLC